MGQKYLCNTWQGFIQQLVTLVGHGYSQYCLISYPEQKRPKWPEIDQKLIKKYESDLGKDQRYRRQLKGVANCMFLRWESCVVILRSAGESAATNDTFYAISDRTLIIPVGDTLKLKIVPVGSRGTCTVYIDKTVLRDIKAELLDHCRHRKREVLMKRFQALNGIPAFSGVTQQKAGLVTALIMEAKRHGMKLTRKDLLIRTGRKVHKVFL